ncbi:hypothetical protein EJ04DRAFT_360486 [Polyplosphaeria fusca]|uniref:Uncharacterized protein n=1 Tax=Polyplosphaeria fusca TaxID=682080 RepID=A0A9P4V078_9PLEO|nr:hypothetical protein EJ04DRAFT_360486 [Polyplosphaeria fusca]
MSSTLRLTLIPDTLRSFLGFSKSGSHDAQPLTRTAGAAQSESAPSALQPPPFPATPTHTHTTPQIPPFGINTLPLPTTRRRTAARTTKPTAPRCHGRFSGCAASPSRSKPHSKRLGILDSSPGHLEQPTGQVARTTLRHMGANIDVCTSGGVKDSRLFSSSSSSTLQVAACAQCSTLPHRVDYHLLQTSTPLLTPSSPVLATTLLS